METQPKSGGTPNRSKVKEPRGPDMLEDDTVDEREELRVVKAKRMPNEPNRR